MLWLRNAAVTRQVEVEKIRQLQSPSSLRESKGHTIHQSLIGLTFKAHLRANRHRHAVKHYRGDKFLFFTRELPGVALVNCAI